MCAPETVLTKQIKYTTIIVRVKIEKQCASGEEYILLNLDYLCGENRDIYIRVNGGEPVFLQGLNSGSFSRVATITVQVPLKAGDNTIELYNDNAYAQDVDRIRIDSAANIAPLVSVSATTGSAFYPVSNINDLNMTTTFQRCEFSSFRSRLSSDFGCIFDWEKQAFFTDMI